MLLSSEETNMTRFLAIAAALATTLALASTTEAPRISTRCAVFARTDLVHAQQAGYSLEEICDGLCRGLAQNLVDTLLGGESLEQPVIMAGGVALTLISARPPSVPA